jgi:hypothetical protein
MEYHADRFYDHSLIIWKKNKLAAVFPANECNGILHSHQGLTFGGLVHGEQFYVTDVLEFYLQLKEYLHVRKLRRLICKPVPFPYTRGACQAQEYALTHNGGRLVERHLSSGIDLHDPLPMSELRNRGVKKALKAGLRVEEGQDFQMFLDMLGAVLLRHNVTPKHSVGELALLQSRFPHDIKLVHVSDDRTMLAGVLMFLTKTAAHMQYICASPDGRKCGALDLLIHTLIERQRTKCRWFCFGISTENFGEILNAGLMHQKEGFGARAFVHDIYALDAR